MQGVVFDKDNTLTEPFAKNVDPRLADSLGVCLREFGGSKVVVYSNSAGLKQYDPEGVFGILSSDIKDHPGNASNFTRCFNLYIAMRSVCHIMLLLTRMQAKKPTRSRRLLGYMCSGQDDGLT